MPISNLEPPEPLPTFGLGIKINKTIKNIIASSIKNMPTVALRNLMPEISKISGIRKRNLKCDPRFLGFIFR